jgi:PAS domain S-box-containing protein
MKYNIGGMNALDIYLSNLSVREYEEVKICIQDYKPKIMPLLSWDTFKNSYSKRIVQGTKDNELNKVLSFAKKFNWKNDFFSVLSENDYEALIITDINQNIVWVNDGFTTMTGYSKKFAINKTPNFLQGKETSKEVKKRIGNKLSLKKPFQEIIINHRKDDSTYKCEIKIFPLYNNEITHYIALERQVS